MIPSLVPLILPLTILVTSIMTFGNFAENNEFAAMKSAGISLQRAMSGLIVFIVVLGYVTYQFSNTIIPWSENKTLTLRRNLAKIKPAMAINENRFSKIGDYVIRVEEKSGENGEFLEDVYIRKKGRSLRDNNETIKSKTGEFKTNSNPNLISLVLKDGNYYNEISPKDYQERQKRPFVKTAFKEHILNIDISELNKNTFTEDSVIHPYKGLNTAGLLKNLDSVANNYVNKIGTFNKAMKQRNGFLNSYSENAQTNSKRKFPSKTVKENDSILNNVLDSKGFYNIDSLLLEQPKRIYSQVLNSAKNNLSAIRLQVKSNEKILATKSRILNRIELELHKKYALGISCIVLFFVGAPLGAIIRKGGLGLPLVVSILLFLAYHFFGIFSGNSAETGSMSPFVAAWISTFVMLPLGVYLTYRATTDQGFLNLDVILDPIKKITKKLRSIKKTNDDD